MNDEQQIRTLLSLAAEPSDQVQPPVERLLDLGHRARKIRAAWAVLSVAVVAAATFALPPVIRSLSSGPSGPSVAGNHSGISPAQPGRQRRGPTAGELSRFRWSALPPSPLGPRFRPLLAWTGRELLEIGGTKNATMQDDGAAFVLASERWQPIAPMRHLSFTTAVDVWTGRQLFVTNGQSAACRPGQVGQLLLEPCPSHAGLYDPASNRWTTTLLPKQMGGLDFVAPVWTGRDVILAGVNTDHTRLRVAAYDPATRRWLMITPGLPARHPPVGLAMVATQNRVLLWSLWSRTKKVSTNGYAIYSGIDVLALGRGGRWSTVTASWPQDTVVEDPSYGNDKILIPPGQIWCGLCSHPSGDSPAKVADAATLALTALPAGPLVGRFPDIEPPLWLWNGNTAMAANTKPSGPVAYHMAAISQLAAFDPSSNRWHTLPVPSGSPPLAANPLWGGQRLLLLTANGGLLAFHS
jgi:hypothetical protein